MAGAQIFTLTILLLSCLLSGARGEIGMNYGQMGSNLPAPAEAARLFQSMGIRKGRLINADRNVLEGFRGSGVSFMLGIENALLPCLADPKAALIWVKENVVPALGITSIHAVSVGEEVLTGSGEEVMSALLPAIRNIHRSLHELGLDARVAVSTPHSLSTLANSYPPSSGIFRTDLVGHLQPLLDFLSQIGAPFMVNILPYYAYKGDPSDVPLPYCLSQPDTSGVTDPNTGLNYASMFDAQVDAVYSALGSLGYPNLELLVSETGWPSAGDPDEPAATKGNAQTYVDNLVQRLSYGHGTPLRPDLTFDTYIFSLFNQNLKPGPSSERNYGLFNPDGTKVYSFSWGDGIMPPASTSAMEIPKSLKGLSSTRKKKWCIPKPGTSTSVLAANIAYACRHGAGCAIMKPKGLCFFPSLSDRASFAMTSFYYNTNTCNFNGSALISHSHPSFVGSSSPSCSIP